MKKFYSEEIIKDLKHRQDYIDSITDFLQSENDKLSKERSKFISPSKLKQNHSFYKNEYVKTLGFPLTQSKQTPCAKSVFVAEDQGVNIYRLYFTFPCGIKGYGLYFKQIKRGDNPFVVAIHGGAGTPEIISDIYMESANYNHLVRRLTSNSVDVFVPQLLLWDTATYGNEYNRAHVDGKLRQLGGSITALEVWLLSSYIDWFIQNEDINADKIGVVGLSYGGMYTTHLTAYDERVKTAFSSSWVNDSFVHSWCDWSYKDMAKKFTVSEIIGLIAPRKFVVSMGNKDELFSYKDTEKIVANAKPYYGEYDALDNLKCVIFDGCHEVNKQDTELEIFLSAINS